MRIMLWFNAPLFLLIVPFNFWRAYVHGEGGVCSDIVCTLTKRYGDMSPVVLSFAEGALKRGASVNVSLVRELLLFNVTFGLATALVTILAFALAFPKLDLIGPIRYPAAILVIPPAIAILAFMLYTIGWDTYWPRPNSYRGNMGRLIFTYWAGAFVYNGRCLALSVFGMLFVFNLFNVIAYLHRRLTGRGDDRI
ncbi:MAG: hypothetical protein ACOZAM_34000 [Pseudomonadota bacterium]